MKKATKIENKLTPGAEFFDVTVRNRTGKVRRLKIRAIKMGEVKCLIAHGPRGVFRDENWALIKKARMRNPSFFKPSKHRNQLTK